MPWENLEEAFKELDANEFAFFARSLAAYRRSLMKQGFTRKEAMRLVESYSKFIYDMSLEEYMHSNDEHVISQLTDDNITDNDDEDFDVDDDIDDDI